ncbi:DUF6538 domain-containing protein [Devosia psychrophila]|uniref:DUF6538 domain-containing protein n=1 Tax=Devosia psychrophila TaxID=728005 RepID=A0A1I1P4S9_9HYPH|nr:hypothetical protein SAMN04488059_117105 [Devosia psychrophila]
MGTRLPFCIRRGAIFYWRRRLPSPAKMSVEFSLGTKDERVARRLCFLLAIESDRAFTVMREGGMTPEQAEVFIPAHVGKRSLRCRLRRSCLMRMYPTSL